MSEKLPRPFLYFSSGVACLGLAALVATMVSWQAQFSTQLVLVLAAVLVSEFYLLRLKTHSVSLAMPLILTSIVVAGPGAGGIAALAASVSPSDIRDRRPWPLMIFNLGQLSLSSSFAGIAYVAVGGLVLIGGEESALTADTAPRTLAAVLFAALVFNATNIALMSVGVWLGRGVPLLVVLGDLAGPLPTHIALAFVGLLMAQVLAISPVAFPLFLFPLFLARQVFQRYATLKETYLDTVRSLIGALEAKDPYTRGHSERVAAYASAIGRYLNLDEKSVQTIEQAALLHDIGKLSLSHEVLNKPSQLSQEEQAEVRRHPWVGGDMILKIPALRHLADAVRAHHERLDGSGYPIGLRGEEIPQMARVLAIADAYDAMTTHRPYRAAMGHVQALAEIAANADSQFDAVLVRAFAQSPVRAAEPSERVLEASEPAA